MTDLPVDGEAPQGEKLEIRYIALGEAVLWDQNPKRHDLGKLAESIQKYGFRDAPIFDTTLGQVPAGNGRILALRWIKNQGWPAPRGILVRKTDGEWFVPIQFGIDAKTVADAVGFAVDHNNLVMLGGDLGLFDISRMWDPTFGELLKQWSLEGSTFTTLDGDDIDALLRVNNQPPGDKPPTLEQLEKQYGEHDPSRMWPEIKILVSPDTLAVYNQIMEELDGENPGEKFRVILDSYLDATLDSDQEPG